MKISDLYGPQRCSVCKRSISSAIEEQTEEHKSCGHPSCSFKEEINKSLLLSSIQIKTFRVSAKKIQLGGLITVDWEINNGDEFILHYNTLTIPVDSKGSCTFNPVKNSTVFIEIKSGKYSIRSQQIFIEVQKPVKLYVSEVRHFCFENEIINFSWEALDAKKVFFKETNGKIEVIANRGTKNLKVNRSTSFQISGENDFDKKELKIDITVFKKPVVKNLQIPTKPDSPFTTIPSVKFPINLYVKSKISLLTSGIKKLFTGGNKTDMFR